MIDIYCQYFGNSGDAQHGRLFTNALSDNYTIALHPWDQPAVGSVIPEQSSFILNNAKAPHQENISIGIGQLHAMESLPGKRKIAFTVWETTLIPKDKLAILASIDEIWTPSSWGKSILTGNGIAEDKVHVVPEGVDAEVYKPLKLPDNDTQEKPFRFLCVGKWEARKGMDKLIRAWTSAFLPEDSVELVLHCHNPYVEGFNLQKTLERLELKSAPIFISNPLYDSAAMVDLYNSCDAFVLPTRAEGWGLPIIEAMACAKPVIVTNHSAYLDYVNIDNAYLIDVERMSRVYDPHFFDHQQNYGEWAEPDMDHLITLMQHVVNNRDEAIRKGRRARKDVAGNWTWGHAAQKARQIIGQAPFC